MGNKFTLFKKYGPITIVLLFALATALGLLQREPNQYTLNNQNADVKLTGEEQNELWNFYNKAKELAPQKSEVKSTASFLAVGDIMLSRNVAAASFKALDVELPFRKMKDTLLSTDFNFGNLESPFFAASHPCSVGPGTMEGIVGGHSLIFGAPCNMRAGLKDYNFKVLSLANNHALDQGTQGLEWTNNLLDDLGIKHIGTGNNQEEAWQPAAIEANGIKICFVGASYASLNDGGKTTNDYVARIEDLDNLKLKIENLKLNCDFIVASMHAGTEYTTKPNGDQIGFAHAAIDAGADMVIGHHPHWVQTIERYCPHPLLTSPLKGEESAVPLPRGEGDAGLGCPNPKYIFYSLGNFIFDQMWSQETREGLTLKIQISKNKTSNLQGPRQVAALESIELIPVIIENYSTPRPADEKETKKILERLGQTDTLLYP